MMGSIVLQVVVNQPMHGQVVFYGILYYNYIAGCCRNH